jgi:glutamate racemase
LPRIRGAAAFEDLCVRKFEELSGHAVRVVDSAPATAYALEEMLRGEGSASADANAGSLELFVTDMPGKFAEFASRFLGHPVDLEEVRQIDL